ncbi:MAG: hypothetical protein V3U45_00795, partial [bacterium]
MRPVTRRSAPALLGLAVLLSAGAIRQGHERYAPQEWKSYTVTRFARSVAAGPRFVGLGTEGGLLFYDRLSDRWSAPLTRADGIPATQIVEIVLRKDGRFQVRTRREVGVVDPLTMRYTPEPFAAQPPPPPSLLSLPNNLFMDPDYLYLPDGRISGPAGISVPIVGTAPDEGARLWVITWGLGAGLADLRTLGLEMKPQGLWVSDVRALVVEAGRVIAGGSGEVDPTGGITEWEQRSGAWRYTLASDTRGLLSDRVPGRAPGGRHLWVGVWGGGARRDGRGAWRTWTRRDGLPDDRTTALAAGAGAVWVGTFRGAVAVAGDTLTPLPLPADRAVLDVSVGAGGVWWATEGGAYGYRGRWPEGRVVQLDHPEGRLDGQVDGVGTWGSEVWWGGPMGVVAY